MPVRPSAPAPPLPASRSWEDDVLDPDPDPADLAGREPADRSEPFLRCPLLIDGHWVPRAVGSEDGPIDERSPQRIREVREIEPPARRRARGSRIWYPWQAQGLARISLLAAGWDAIADDDVPEGSKAHFDALLDEAERACTTKLSLGQRFSGVVVERAWTHLHAAEALLVASADAETLPYVLSRAADLTTRSLPADSIQRTVVAALAPGEHGPTPAWLVGLAVEAAHRKGDAAHDRARSFRNVVLAAAGLVGIAVLSLVAFALASPTSLPMCTAGGSSCVIDGSSRTLDVPLVALVGAAAGTLSGVVALRRLRGTSTPYRVPLALAALKIPTGALTAVLGLLVLRAGFANTAFAAESAAGLLGWAVVLGLAQEALTRLADRQGELVLNTITPASPPPSAAIRS